MNVLNAGVNPSGLMITPDDRHLLVANNNNYGLPDQDTVSVFDLKHMRLVKNIKDKSFNEPYTISYNGDVCYVCNAGSPSVAGQPGVISVVSLKDFKVISLIESDQLDGPSGMAIIKGYGYVLNYGAAGGVKSGNGKTITIINLKDNKVVGSIPVPLAPAAITRKGRYLAVASYVDGNEGTGVVTIIGVNESDYKIMKTFKGFSGPFDIKWIDNYVYVTNFGSNNFAPFGRTVTIQSVKDESLAPIHIDVGIQPSCLDILPDQHKLVVSCYNTLYSDPINYHGLTAGQGTLVYLDLRTHKIIKTIKTSASPANIVVSADGKYTYVACYTGGVVDVIEN